MVSGERETQVVMPHAGFATRRRRKPDVSYDVNTEHMPGKSGDRKKKKQKKKKNYLPRIFLAVFFHRCLFLVQLQGHLVTLLNICEKKHKNKDN